MTARTPAETALWAAVERANRNAQFGLDSTATARVDARVLAEVLTTLDRVRNLCESEMHYDDDLAYRVAADVLTILDGSDQ